MSPRYLPAPAGKTSDVHSDRVSNPAGFGLLLMREFFLQHFFGLLVLLAFIVACVLYKS